MPQISIIVPVYKVEKYLERCVDSILAQTFKDFELILVDDGSPDKCPEICDEYAKKDSRVSVIHRENGGLSVARNTALDIAKGEYIGFVDSDDYIHPQMYEILYKNIVDNNADVSTCDIVEGAELIQWKHIAETETSASKGSEIVKKWIVGRVRCKPYIVCNKLFRRECFDIIRFPEGRICEDISTTPKILYEADTVVECNAPMYYYFQNSEGLSCGRYTVKQLDRLTSYEDAMRFYEAQNEPVLTNEIRKLYCYYLADNYFKIKNILHDKKLAKKLKKQLRQQQKLFDNKFTVENTPVQYQVLHPVSSYLYWFFKGQLQKLKGKG